jgi:hypothetical protein
MFILKISFYGLLVIFTMIAVFLLFANLFGSSPYTPVREKFLTTAASVSALGVLYFAFRYGHIKENWAAGIGIEFLAVFVFLVIMIGGLLTGKIHWQ